MHLGAVRAGSMTCTARHAAGEGECPIPQDNRYQWLRWVFWALATEVGRRHVVRPHRGEELRGLGN